ncbi:hypothetical protein H9657_18260 [Cellulomonas sp. Sa3CUA2]|uniref:Lipoprotein n=1 Tax=Cellulomonas avistercoris TaxID=2762242 RepID=A0ABR8QIG6_9CELL|nr:hypothetical protein [Cellulomonas avistercoris]MBD7920220.1 hypothetical protein [Cellulomonas avistercoris]
MRSTARHLGLAAPVVLALLVAGCTTATPEPGPSTTSTAPSPTTAAPSTPASTGSPDAGPTPDASAPASPTGDAAPVPEAPDDDAPVITNARFAPDTQELEVTGYVPAVHDGGTCELVATRSAATVRASRDAAPDATTTACGTLVVARDQLTAGTWSVRLAFTPPGGSTIVSASREVAVP